MSTSTVVDLSRPAAASGPLLGSTAFQEIRRMLLARAGIHLADSKHTLVTSRLARRLAATGCGSYEEYLERTRRDAGELQTCIDLLTTNETYFFREEKHFEFLAEQLLPAWRGGEFRAWSAASSSGEEAYSVAMVLADALGERPWRVFGSDISTQVLARARKAVYPVHRAERIPPDYLRRFCLKGVAEQAGNFAIASPLRRRVDFAQINLLQPPAALGGFDLILLRNVMIYFQQDTKRAVVQGLLHHLKPGGYLFIGHSESLFGVCETLEPVAPAIYRKR